ncbi:hypothetical protein [Streptosporangium canum]|uniref:hypothetical protein n=1 Tax=Streptosporangium canum TaxID=324952 RepID=UPI0037B45364
MTQPAQQQDPNSEPNAVEVLGNVIAGIGHLFSSVQGWVQSGAGMLTLLSVFMLGTGGIIGHFSGALFDASSSSKVSMIKGAWILDTTNKGNPSTGHDEYLVYIKFPDPEVKTDCDGDCKKAVGSVTESRRGCLAGMCTAELKNTNQPDLKSGAASHWQNKLQAIKGTDMTVNLVVSGSRVSTDDAYPNILLVDEVGQVLRPWKVTQPSVSGHQGN